MLDGRSKIKISWKTKKIKTRTSKIRKRIKARDKLPISNHLVTNKVAKTKASKEVEAREATSNQASREANQ